MSRHPSLRRGGLAALICAACCAGPLIVALGLAAGIAAMAAVLVGVTAAVASGLAVMGLAARHVRARRRRTGATTRVELSARPAAHADSIT